MPHALPFLPEIWTALGADAEALVALGVEGEGALPSVFAVTELAAAAVGAAGLAAAELIKARHGERPAVRVDRRLASFWFGWSLRPEGWQLPPVWDAVAGDYAAADGWIRLHTNAPRHRAAALKVLGVGADREQVGRAVAHWNKTALESAIVEQGGCAAAMHTADEWALHPQGRAVALEPLVLCSRHAAGERPRWAVAAERPLRGLRVLDLTRILAGPVATRFLAGLGAEVLRLDPPGWEEASVEPEVTLGKRCARLDLKTGEGRAIFTELLAGADVLVHGYRPGALAALGFDADQRRRLQPGLVEVSLDAYGWSGPWRGRRGFDSLVQMSSGIAAAGMRLLGKERPFPLPVQALDHACGYLMAAAVLTGLRQRLLGGQGYEARLSLARLAALLVAGPAGGGPLLAIEAADDLNPQPELTAWGPARRLRAPVCIGGRPLAWDLAAAPLGSAAAGWRDQGP